MTRAYVCKRMNTHAKNLKSIKMFFSPPSQIPIDKPIFTLTSPVSLRVSGIISNRSQSIKWLQILTVVRIGVFEMSPIALRDLGSVFPPKNKIKTFFFFRKKLFRRENKNGWSSMTSSALLGDECPLWSQGGFLWYMRSFKSEEDQPPLLGGEVTKTRRLIVCLVWSPMPTNSGQMIKFVIKIARIIERSKASSERRRSLLVPPIKKALTSL